MFIEYDDYINSQEWYAKRALVLERNKGMCEHCKVKKAVHIHHLTYSRFGNELLEDLQALCFDCHQAKHPDKKLKREYLLISNISKQLNVTVLSLKKVLFRHGWMISSYVSFDGITGKENWTDMPSLLAFERKIAKRQPRTKSKGQRGPWVWDIDKIKILLDCAI